MSEYHKEHPQYEELGIFARYGEHDPAMPYFVASECGNKDCRDRYCPYTHGTGWKIDGMRGLYNSEDDAMAAYADWKPPA